MAIRLYKVEAWSSERSETARKVGKETMFIPNLVFGMVQGLEIGLICEAKQFLLRNKGVSVDSSFITAEVVNSIEAEEDELKTVSGMKDFRFSHLDLRVEFSKTDLTGKTVDMDRSSENIAAAPYSRISLNNIPNQLSIGIPASPKEACLEMSIKLTESRVKQKSKAWFFVDPNQHVSSMDVFAARDDQPFRVMIDGVHFGPFRSIRVSPFEVDGRHLSLPISTFFPIQ